MENRILLQFLWNWSPHSASLALIKKRKIRRFFIAKWSVLQQETSEIGAFHFGKEGGISLCETQGRYPKRGSVHWEDRDLPMTILKRLSQDLLENVGPQPGRRVLMKVDSNNVTAMRGC